MAKTVLATQKEIFAKCVVWYVVAVVLAPLPYIAFGERELIPWCAIGLPSLPMLVFFMHDGTNPTGFILVGYLLHLGLAAKAISAHDPAVRQTCYVIYCCLLVLDVCVAWFGPLCFFLVEHPAL